MKKNLFFVLLVLIAMTSFSQKIAELPEVVGEVTGLDISGDRIFVTTRRTVHIYTLKGFKHIKEFGKVGRGPGEFRLYFGMDVYDDKLLINSLAKLMFFSHDGKLLKEIRKKKPGLYSHPLGERMVGVDFNNGKRNVNLYDNKLQLLKTIYTSDSSGNTQYYNSDPTVVTDYRVLTDYVSYTIYKNNLFMGDTSKGFWTAVFDASGKKKYEINRKYKKEKITPNSKNEMIKNLTENAKKINKRYNYIFPDYIPAYNYIMVRQDKIYFFCYDSRLKQKIIVTDLKGTFIREVPIADIEGEQTIYNDKLYHIFDNEDEETYELMVVDLNPKN
ncbi:MAG: hypothetical protein GY757_48060 [bacterium]|nr:hypothetical protein [bacterium]